VLPWVVLMSLQWQPSAFACRNGTVSRCRWLLPLYWQCMLSSVCKARGDWRALCLLFTKPDLCVGIIWSHTLFIMLSLHWLAFEILNPGLTTCHRFSRSQEVSPPYPPEILIYMVTTLQTTWNSLTFLWRFAALLHGTRHIKCYSYIYQCYCQWWG